VDNFFLFLQPFLNWKKLKKMEKENRKAGHVTSSSPLFASSPFPENDFGEDQITLILTTSEVNHMFYY
jgi:hypothetical protein